MFYLLGTQRLTCTYLAVAFETIVTRAVVQAVGVRTVGVLVAVMRFLAAFVDSVWAGGSQVDAVGEQAHLTIESWVGAVANTINASATVFPFKVNYSLHFGKATQNSQKKHFFSPASNANSVAANLGHALCHLAGSRYSYWKMKSANVQFRG